MQRHLHVLTNRTADGWLKHSPLWLTLTLLFLIMFNTVAQVYGPPTRFEAENGFNSVSTTSSAHAGYSGTGYVTGLVTVNSETKFDKGVSTLTPTKVDIRYANGTGATVTNLALYIGSNQKVQDLVLPSTGSWSTWSTITVTFNHDPSWGSNICIRGTANVSTSANIDYTDLSEDDGTAATAASPTFSPAAGTYTSAQSVALSTTTSGATIRYTTDGTTPTASSTAYASPISVASTQTIKAIAIKSGLYNSSVASATYTINLPAVATPTFSPAAGTYATTQSVSISTTTSGATIYYTTNGSTPTTSSSVYSTPISVATTQTVKALAVKSGMANSSVASALYTISSGTVATPTFSPAAGTYASAQSVTLSTATSGATLYYTTDGSTPTTTSSVYSAAISVATTQTVKALAAKSGMTNSIVASATYTISSGTVATPTFSPAAGTYASAQSVSLSSTTSGATIYYTTNGSTPTTSSSVYASPISVSATQTIKAIGAKSGMTNSSVASASYTISTPPPASQPGVIREVWTGVSGTAVSNLTSNANYPNSPSSSGVIATIDAPRDVANSYGQRIKGYLAPTVTGNYKFWISSDDDSELWLSTTSDPANKVKIASLTGWTNPETYDQNSSQASTNIALTAGNYYYIEALHKENDGGDHVTVAWQVPGGSRVTIPGANLVTAPPVPLPQPGTFNQTAPASGATAVSLSPTFTWGASSDAATYTLVVSTNSSFTSPVINQSGIAATTYAGGGLAGNTLYYWKVTAINASGTRVATNAGISFTTLVPPAPGAFTQTAPASAATSVSRNVSFTWAAASNASTYTLVVSTNSAYTSPIINASGLTATNYSHGSPLAGSTLYYWKVTAVNSTGSTIASNAGISFTTSATTGTYYYVATSGVDAVGRGSQANPFRTLAYAATQVAANQNNTIYLNAGTYIETVATVLPLGVNIEGAGESSVTVTSNGAIPAPGVDTGSNNYHLWYDGSIIQLASPIYTGANPKYGSPAEMIAATNGNQTISGFTLDGHSKAIKAGFWVENRNNVTLHHVTFRNFQIHGAVFSRGDMWWYEPIANGKWMQNSTIYNCTFTNCAADGVGGGSSGNLCLGGLDGADIYNITVNENQGYGIKFKHVGHLRNVKVHDCTITVPETDPDWGEDISIELWNLSYDNEIYNIVCNTWLSLVNHVQFNDYQPTVAHPSNLKVRNVRMVDQDGSSGKESIECALSGVEISQSYFQDKGFGIAIWGGTGWGGSIAIHDINIHNNIFANVNRSIQYGFGNSAGVFIPDPANTIKIHNNVFDKMGNGLQLNSGSSISIKNNAFLNAGGDDVQGGSSLTFTNNLRYNTDPLRTNWQVSTTANATNVQGAPGFQNSGSRWDTYYKPSSPSSFAVDKGTDVGLAFNGTAPDIGRWEYGLAGGRVRPSDPENVYEVTSTTETADANQEEAFDIVSVYPNPTRGKITISPPTNVQIHSIAVTTTQGKVILSRAVEGGGKTVIDLSDQVETLLILHIKHDKGILSKKILIVK